jgi:uncharacterized protein YjlB
MIELRQMVECIVHRTPKHPDVLPNSFRPVLLYREAITFFGKGKSSNRKRFADLCSMAGEHGWYGDWMDRNAVLTTTHYHPDAHEALVVIRGGATIRIGGQGFGSKEFRVADGDVLLIPAGVGHRRVEKAEIPFTVAGFYPIGQTWTTLGAGKANYTNGLEQSQRVPLPTADPFYGPQGPLLKYWAKFN